MTNEDLIREFLSGVREGIRKQQQDKGLVASGASADSLEIVSDENSGQLIGADYIYYQIHGRGPGKMPPIKSIEEYVAIKLEGWDPWAIAVNIAKHGSYIFRHPGSGLDLQLIIDEETKDFYDKVGDEVARKILNLL